MRADLDWLQPGRALILHCESSEQRKHLHWFLDTHYGHLGHRSVLVSCIPQQNRADVMLYRHCRCGKKYVRLDRQDEYEGKINYVWGTCRRCGDDVVESDNEYDLVSRPHNVMVIQMGLTTRRAKQQPTTKTAPVPVLSCLRVQSVPQYRAESKRWWCWLRSQLPDSWVDAKELVRRASFTGLCPPLLDIVARFVGNHE